MNKTSISVLALVVGMIIGGMLAGVTMNNGALGGVTIEDETFKGDVTVEGEFTAEGDITLTDPTFCVDFYSTSTATAVKMVASTTVASGSNVGLITMQYGSCN